jgi:hypothetical protein
MIDFLNDFLNADTGAAWLARLAVTLVIFALIMGAHILVLYVLV